MSRSRRTRSIQPVVQARHEVPTERIGFDAPPADTHLKLLPGRAGWRLLVWSSGTTDEALVAWVQGHGAFRVDARFGDEPYLVILSSEALPPRWHWMTHDLHVVDLALSEEGVATVTMEGPDEAVTEAFGAVGGDATGILEAMPARWAPGRAGAAILTERQREAVHAALEAGYYDVPRKVRLEELATSMATSKGALSELLRRAERRLVDAYVDAELPGQAGRGASDDA